MGCCTGGGVERTTGGRGIGDVDCCGCPKGVEEDVKVLNTS